MRADARAAPDRRRGVIAGLALLMTFAAAGCGDRSAQDRAATATAASPRAVVIARGIVEVPGGLFDVAAPLDGWVESIAVHEGDQVKRGQVLLRLSSQRLEQELALAEAELRLARARQNAQQVRLPAARQLAARMSEAARAEAIDVQHADEARQAVLEQEAGLRVAAAETALAERKVAQAQAWVQRLDVVAAHDATIVKLFVQPGTRVSAQGERPLMAALPARALQVRAEVNEDFVARVAVGMRASIRLDNEAGAMGVAVPAAHVARVSPIFGASRLEDDAQVRGTVRVVDCFLDFDQAPALRVGQTVRVEFHE